MCYIKLIVQYLELWHRSQTHEYQMLTDKENLQMTAIRGSILGSNMFFYT